MYTLLTKQQKMTKMMAGGKNQILIEVVTAKTPSTLNAIYVNKFEM